MLAVVVGSLTSAISWHSRGSTPRRRRLRRIDCFSFSFTTRPQLAQGLRDAQVLRAAPLKVERLHVTIFHLGAYFGLPRGVVEAAHEAAAALNFSAFDIAFDRVESFYRNSGAQPLVLRGGDGLAALTTFRGLLVQR